MSFVLERVLRNAQPVYVDERHVYVLRGDRLLRGNHDLGFFEPFARLPGKRARQRRIAPRLARRILRLIARAAVACEGFLYLSIKDEIYRIDLESGAASLDLTVPDGLSLLNLSVVTREGGDRSVCFGEYSANLGRIAIRVWRRSTATEPDWTAIPLFPQGEIEHVHGIRQLADGGVVVMTGDFGGAAAMWLCTPEFTEARRWSPEGQTFRACWLWEAPGGARWWATDSQFDRNNLMTADAGAAISDARVAVPLPGSSIYAAEGVRDMVFSTAVEPGATGRNLIGDLLSRTPGPGIVGRDAVIYALADGRAREIARARKDTWPLRLAQFGAFQFPAGQLPVGRIYAYGVAVKGYDDACLSFRER